MPDVLTRHVRIHGEVQGVGFRAWTVRTATELGLSGWVRNCADGTVEAVLRGPSAAVDDMVRRCGEGPRYASVSAVHVLKPEPGGDDEAAIGSGFVVRR